MTRWARHGVFALAHQILPYAAPAWQDGRAGRPVPAGAVTPLPLDRITLLRCRLLLGVERLNEVLADTLFHFLVHRHQSRPERCLLFR